MLSRHDLNRVNVFKKSLQDANKTLYNASEKEVIEYFNSQDELIKDIKDLPLRNKLLAESKYIRVQALSNHQTHTSTIDKLKELTLKDGIYTCSSEKEANDYFDSLDKDIQDMPTDKESKDGLIKLSQSYRETTLENLKK